MNNEFYGPNHIGNVIRIIDRYTLIINVGKPLLKKGDHICVYEAGDTLKDLDGSTLCIYEHAKDVLEVIDTTDLYSVCRKNKTTISSVSEAFANIAVSPLMAKSYEALEVDDSQIEPLEAQDDVIHIGDPVKLA